MNNQDKIKGHRNPSEKEYPDGSPPEKEDLGDSPYIPYNTHLKELARKNRKNPTKAEKKMWYEVLKNKNLEGYTFLRQKPLVDFIADFYCSKLLLVIEIDGNWHAGEAANEYDKERTLILNQFGIKVIRFKNNEVLNNINMVHKRLSELVMTRKKDLNL